MHAIDAHIILWNQVMHCNATHFNFAAFIRSWRRPSESFQELQCTSGNE